MKAHGYWIRQRGRLIHDSVVIALGLLVTLGMLVGLTSTGKTASQPTAFSTSCSSPDWYAVDLPETLLGDDLSLSLTGFARLSPDDVWAVGATVQIVSGRADLATERGVVLHWNGTVWAIVPNPAVDTRGFFTGVAAISSNDVWVLGSVGSAAASQSLILHWTGSAWTTVPSPNPGTIQNSVGSPTVLASNNIWAVGHYKNASGKGQPYTIHWDGAQWNLVPAPDPSYEPDPRHPNPPEGILNFLTGVSAVSPTDIWAVGSYKAAYTSTYTLIEHWDGSEWSIMPGPNPSNVPGGPGPQNELRSVTALSNNDIWALGDYVQFRDPGRWSQAYRLPLFTHWDGASWTVLPSPNILKMSVLSSNNIWATGPDGIQHWNGSNWSQVPTPNVPLELPSPGQIYAIAADDIWTIGFVQDGSSEAHIHMLHYTCSAPSTPTNTPTATSPATATPVATSTAVPTVQIPEGTAGSARTFAETGQVVSGLFLDYWNQNGALTQQGFPISPVMGEVSDLDSKPYTVQYFERAVFEYHPENQAPYNLLLSQLGTFQYKKKYPSGAPNQQPNDSAGSVLFSETGNRLGGKFLDYWRSHGGLAQQGYPISNEFVEKSELDGQEYLVQYFERAVFEYHPENQPPYDVLLSQLGTFQYNQKYGKN